MKAFHNDPLIKEKYLSRVIMHRKADNLMQGLGWGDGKGCAVGCTLEAYDHSLYPVELGIPEWLARLEDTIFEGLPTWKAMLWPERFLEAIRPGDDLERVKIPILIFIVESTLDKFSHTDFPDVKTAIDGVLKVLRENQADRSAYAAADAATNARADAYAAYAAANASHAARATYAARAADAAANAARAADAAANAARAADAAANAARAADAAANAARAAYAAADAATNARADAYAAYARAGAYEKFADKLIELIEEKANADD